MCMEDTYISYIDEASSSKTVIFAISTWSVGVVVKLFTTGQHHHGTLPIDKAI